MASISVTPIGVFGSADPVRWSAVCYDCQEGRTLSSEEDLAIWTAAHEDRHGESPRA